nr:hypothetical protein [Thermodesulfatator indicus]
MATFGNGKLVDGQKVVIFGIVKVYYARLGTGYGAILPAIFYRHSVHEHSVEGPVTSLYGGAGRIYELSESLI